MKNKDDIRDQFSPLLDGELAPEERASLEAALSDDAELLRELDSLKRVDDLYRAMPAVSAPDDFEVVVRERISPRRVAAVAAAAAPPPSRQVARRRFAPLLAAAAALVICAGAIVFVIGGGSNREQLARFDAETAPNQKQMRSVSEAPAPAPAVASDVVSTEELLSGRAKEEALSEMPESTPPAATPIPQDAPKDSAYEMPLQVADASSATGQSASGELKQDAADRVERDERQRGGVVGADAPGEVSLMAKPASPGLPAAPAPETPAAVELGAVGRTPATAPMSEAPSPAKAKAAEKPDASTIRRSIGARSFTLRGGVWYERGYAEETTVAMLRDSDAFRALVKEYANVEKLVTLKEPVVFKAGEYWYKMPPDRSEN